MIGFFTPNNSGEKWLDKFGVDKLSQYIFGKLKSPVSVIFHQSMKCLGSVEWQVYYFHVSYLVICMNAKYGKAFYHSLPILQPTCSGKYFSFIE